MNFPPSKFQQLVIFVINALTERGYKVHDGMIYTPVTTTGFYTPLQNTQEFVWSLIDITAYDIFLASTCFTTYLPQVARLVQFYNSTSLTVDHYRLSFNDGVYYCKQDKFTRGVIQPNEITSCVYFARDFPTTGTKKRCIEEIVNPLETIVSAAGECVKQLFYRMMGRLGYVCSDNWQVAPLFIGGFNTMSFLKTMFGKYNNIIVNPEDKYNTPYDQRYNC